MSERNKYRLSDLMQIKYGKDHKHLADGVYPLYGSGGIMRFVEKPLYEEESILIPRKGTLSNLFYLDHPFWSVDTMFYSKINKELVLPKYLFYTLKTYDLASLNVGSAVPSLTTEVLNEVLVSIPALSTQTTIAEILSSLDDKIELNNKINQELETLAQTLFKQWFIDFEFPNKNGEPYKSSGGEMVDSELGEIPKNWVAERLGNHLYIKGRIGWKGLKKSEYLKESEGYSIVNGSDFINEQIDSQKCGWITKERFDDSPEIQLKINDILITKDGTIGKLAFVDKISNPTSVASGIFVVRPSTLRVTTFFCWSFFKSPYFQNLVKYKIEGSVIPHLYQRDFVEMYIPLPPLEVLNSFENIVKDIFKNVFSCKEEIKQLQTLRDTLLPKLISGELEINEISN
jgi:type I restriction enzyme S subunit